MKEHRAFTVEAKKVIEEALRVAEQDNYEALDKHGNPPSLATA